MSEVFVSYARSDEPQAIDVAAALRAEGYRVWRDDELPAHRAYADVIEERIKGAVEAIQQELEERLKTLKDQGKLLEAQRLAARTRYDMEMLLEVGYCSRIENYSRPLSGRKPGETPNTLLD